MPSLVKELNEIAKYRHLDLATLTRTSGIMYATFFAEEGTEASSEVIANAAKEVFQLCTLPENNFQAMLEWCPTEAKPAIGDLWGPIREDFKMMNRVKTVFDPHDVLSPGRFAGGI